MDELKKALIEEAREHRKFLHESLRHMAWPFVALVGVGLYFLGDSASAAASSAAQRALDERKTQDRIERLIRDQLDEAQAQAKAELSQTIRAEFDATGNQQISDLFDAKLDSLEIKSIDQVVQTEAENAVARLAILLPVGTILPWTPSASDEPLPDGWERCDGVDGRPDLNGRMLLGAVQGSHGTYGGSLTTGAAGTHDHGGKTRRPIDDWDGHPAIKDGHYQVARASDSPNWHHQHSIAPEPSHAHSAPFPPNFTVVFIIKVR